MVMLEFAKDQILGVDNRCHHVSSTEQLAY
jgi:hypothetical protein